MRIYSHHEPNCNLCGLVIRRGLQVYYNNKPFHPTCSVTVAKENISAGTRQITESPTTSGAGNSQAA